jgi:drug/metabolite transporter (DMT)-like permease
MSIPDVPWQIRFGLLAIVWGCSFWWIALGLRALEPIQVAAGRLILGALTLLIICSILRVSLPRGREVWRHIAIVALLLNSAPFTFFAFGQVRVASILAGIINACTPLAVLGVTILAFPEEKPTRRRVQGLAVGFVGVLILLGVWRSIPGGELLGIVACLAAISCYGVAFPYARRHLSPLGMEPVALAAAQVSIGALILAPLLVWNTVAHPVDFELLTSEVVIGMAALGVLSTGLAYVLNFSIIDVAGSSTASSVTYLTPIVAAAAGTLFLDEPIALRHVAGALVVVAGIMLSRSGQASASRPSVSQRG